MVKFLCIVKGPQASVKLIPLILILAKIRYKLVSTREAAKIVSQIKVCFHSDETETRPRCK